MATHCTILAQRIPMHRGAWQATVHTVTKTQRQLKRLSTHTRSVPAETRQGRSQPLNRGQGHALSPRPLDREDGSQEKAFLRPPSPPGGSGYLWGVAVLVAQSCLTLCDPVDGSPPGSSVRRILQARTCTRIPVIVVRVAGEPIKRRGAIVNVRGTVATVTMRPLLPLAYK